MSLLLYGLLLACCDSEVKAVALEKVKAFFTYITCLILNHTHFRTDEKDEVFSLLSRSSKYHGILMHLSLGVVPVMSPFVVSFPPDCLSPLVVTDVLVALLDNEFPSVDDLVVEASLVFWKVVEEQAQAQASVFVSAAQSGGASNADSAESESNTDNTNTRDSANTTSTTHCNALWMALPYMEAFLASLLLHCVGNGWRCRVASPLLLPRSTTR